MHRVITFPGMPGELVKATVYCVLGSVSTVDWTTILAIVLAVGLVVVVVIIIVVVIVVLTRRRFRSSRFYTYLCLFMPDTYLLA